MTASASAARRSMTLPLPSSPYWAPTITMPGIARRSLGRVPVDEALVLPVHRTGIAHLDEPRDRSLADLVGERVRHEVRGDDRRALVLVARVDDGVELLEHPVARVLRADVVEVQQVDRGELVEQRLRRLAIADRVADDVQQ